MPLTLRLIGHILKGYYFRFQAWRLEREYRFVFKQLKDQLARQDAAIKLLQRQKEHVQSLIP